MSGLSIFYYTLLLIVNAKQIFWFTYWQVLDVDSAKSL